MAVGVVKMHIQFYCNLFQHTRALSTWLNMYTFMVLKSCHFNILVYLKAHVQSSANIQNVWFSSFLSLKHILSLCNLNLDLGVMPWQPPRVFIAMINNSTLMLEMSVFCNPAISHPQPTEFVWLTDSYFD